MNRIDFPSNKRIEYISLFFGIFGALFCLVGIFSYREQFFFSYLVSFSFWISISLGALFLVLLHYLSGSIWSVVLRRIMEFMMAVLPIFVLLFIPIILGKHDLFHWTHQDVLEKDFLLQKKAPYLNFPFFLFRTALYFFVWIFLSRFLFNQSIKNDDNGDEKLLEKSRRIAPIGVILFALTCTFAAFDWLMSLDAHWYSTIFGVYYFGASVLAALCLLTLITIFLVNNGTLKNYISIEHFHDLGRLLFTFTIFWAYISFSQYFLIWYANIPEETVWFQDRWIGSWKIISLILVCGHFVLPFFILLTRSAKRNKTFLIFISFWLLVMNFIDMHWLVVPTLHHAGFHFHWLDISAMCFIGGFFVWYLYRLMSRHTIIPFNDPNIEISIQHRL